MTGARYFSLRRVNPFLGTLQVAAVEGARALSPNGSRWQVELLSQIAVRQPLWADIGPASAERRFFTYGVWGPETGLRRLPVNPMLGDQSGHPALAPLIEALGHMPRLPFPGADQLELWLLDQQGMPLALLAAYAGDRPPTLPLPPAWRALPASEGREAAPEERGWLPDASALERLVATSAGRPARAQWFQRGADGGGLGGQGFRLEMALAGRALPRTAFPETLVRADWPVDALAAALVSALVAWQAPALLTLEGLSPETRRRLERLAARRPMALYRLRRLLPEVVDRGVVETALVEAVIRATG